MFEKLKGLSRGQSREAALNEENQHHRDYYCYWKTLDELRKGRKGIIKDEFGAGLRNETPMDEAIWKDKEKSFGAGNSISTRWIWTGK